MAEPERASGGADASASLDHAPPTSGDDAARASPDDAPHASATGAEGSRRRPFSRRSYSPEEIEAAKQQWRDMRPWDSPMARADKVLISATLAVLGLLLLSLPIRPFLIATHPVALSAVTGSLSAVGSAAAFARVGGTDVWVVVAAGVLGMIKFDWLFWWAGRRWGAKGVRFFTPPGRAQRFVARVQSWPPWTTALLVVAAAMPGVPSLPLFLLAGLAGMPVVAFLVLDAVGSALVVGLVAGLGFGLGQAAVDVVLTINQYALLVSIAFIVVVSFRAGRRGQPGAAR